MDKIICDEVIDTEEKNLMKNIACRKTQSCYLVLTFLFITVILLIAVSIYCYQIKYKPKIITISQHK